MFSYYWNHVTSVIYSFKNHAILKFFGALFVSAYAFLFNVEFTTLLQGLLFLIVFDTISAVFAAFRVGEPIESRKMCRSAFKVFVYFMAIAGGHIVDKAFLLDGFAINGELILIAYFSATELISLLENFGKAGFNMPSRLVNRLKEYTK